MFEYTAKITPIHLEAHPYSSLSYLFLHVLSL